MVCLLGPVTIADGYTVTLNWHLEHRMSTLELKELSHPSGEVIKIASGKTLDLHSQGTTKMPAGSVIQVITKTHSQNASCLNNSIVISSFRFSF